MDKFWLLEGGVGVVLLFIGYLLGRYHERSKLRQRWRRNQVLPTITYMGRGR